MEAKRKTAVMGIGNPLMGDDGIGIRVINEMMASGSCDDVLLIDGGTAPDLLSLPDSGIDRLIIVDALKGNGQAGSVYRLEIGDSNLSEDVPASMHGLSVTDSLLMMKKLGMRRPQVIIIGIEPQDISPGLKLSPVLEGLVPSLIRTVDEEIAAAD